MPEVAKRLPSNPREESLLEKLAERRANQPERIDDSKLYAGSPMHYYCRTCGHLKAVLPETHAEPPPRYCKDCQELKDLGLID